ncbi:nicotinamide N-methyltransferase-like isoform X2 [Hyperolius riggenbachi]|uniref:nicotinamide N-methyltransferase-like isoform X2 n=1 Tax=Hyperolius riggenbachi TaxID=752182 RepID=UPI0035A3C83F
MAEGEHLICHRIAASKCAILLSYSVSCKMKGDLLMDISIGPLVHFLYPMCNSFKEIVLLRFSERCILELRKWQNGHTEAFNWPKSLLDVTALLGDSKELEMKDTLLKSLIKQVVRCDTEKENLTDPLQLPQADGVTSAWILEVISPDETKYQSNLRKILACLKPGGRLFLIGVVGGTYYMVGNQRMHLFNNNANFVEKALAKEGLTVTQREVLPRIALNDLSDYKGMLFIEACKNK